MPACLKPVQADVAEHRRTGGVGTVGGEPDHVPIAVATTRVTPRLDVRVALHIHDAPLGKGFVQVTDGVD